MSNISIKGVSGHAQSSSLFRNLPVIRPKDIRLARKSGQTIETSTRRGRIKVYFKKHDVWIKAIIAVCPLSKKISIISNCAETPPSTKEKKIDTWV